MGDVFLAGIAGVLPPTVSVDEALAAGAWTRREAAETQQLSVTVAPPEQHSPDLAVDAARLALQRAKRSPAQISLALHSMMLSPGGRLWHGAAYVHRQLGVPTGRCITSDLDCGCDSSLVAFELASAYLRGRDEEELALVTAADCWREPEVDRWRSSTCPFGDGAAAAVLSRKGGFARIAGISSLSDPDLEPVGRGLEPFTREHENPAGPVYLRSRGSEIVDAERIWPTVTKDVQHVVAAAAQQAGIAVSDLDHVVCPFLGHDLTKQEFLDPLSLDFTVTPWDFSRRVGHIGPADPLAGLDHLVNVEQVNWRYALLLAYGVGGIFTAVILESTGD